MSGSSVESVVLKHTVRLKEIQLSAYTQQDKYGREKRMSLVDYHFDCRQKKAKAFH